MSTKTQSGVWVKLYMGTKRVVLPLQTRDERPENKYERQNWKKFDSAEDARQAGLASEHNKFGHDNPKRSCPKCM